MSRQTLRQFAKSHPAVEGLLFVLPFAVVWGIFLAWPVFYGIFISLFEWKGLSGMEFIGFRNYADLFREPRFWNALGNTLKFAGMAIPMIVGLGLVFALMLWSWGQGGKGSVFVQSVLFFPYLLTISIVSLTWLWLLDVDYGLVKNAVEAFGIRAPRFLRSPQWVLPSIAFVTTWWLAGYRMLVFQAGLEDIPKELFEVARIDGARPRHNFVHIILPLLKPSLLFSLVLTIIAGFRTFGQVLVMTEGGPGRASEVLALYIYWTGFDYFVPGKAAAAGVLLLLIILGMTLLGVRLIGLKSELD
ncbi:MAG: sugar ABC transporter permease [Spirochaetales bacterium]|nr:sugar ABC transporter permease [Spirochaetales bacterium]